MHARILVAFAAFALAGTAVAEQPTRDHGKGVYHAHACGGTPAAGFARCHAHVVTDAKGRPLARSSAPAGLSPANLRDAYKVVGSGSSSTLIAIVDAYGYPTAESDLAAYRKQFGLPACTTANGCFMKVNQSGVQGNYPRVDTGWSQESALDLDMASAMCPNCRLVLVQANTPSYSDLAAAVRTAAALGAHVISNSYGGSETGSTGYESSYSYTGIAVTVSTGDNGYGVSFPASSPHVVAVGGTSLKTAANARGWTETAWTGAGSGCSGVYAKPSWQTDSGCARRSLADVSAVADPNTGVAVYGPTSRTRSGWMVFGGTSASAPIIGGIYAVNGGNVVYGSDPYAHLSDLFDVTSGNNGSCGGGYLCTSGVGYDGPTGLGTPNGVNAF